MNPKRGDVVLIVAPGDLGKPRPAVVVQSDELNNHTTSFLVCPLSSDIQKTQRIRPLLRPSADNGLRVVSQAMTDKLVALKLARIRRVVGRLDEDSLADLDAALLLVLGLAR